MKAHGTSAALLIVLVACSEQATFSKLVSIRVAGFVEAAGIT